MIKFQPTAFINIIKVMAFKKHTAHGWGNTTEKRERETDGGGGRAEGDETQESQRLGSQTPGCYSSEKKVGRQLY